MGSIVRTANAHQTSLLVSQQIPEFVVADHPKFVKFIEAYYEFMANNTLMATTSNTNVYYYGADTASKILQDIKDVDKTDFDNFVESFRRQYGPAFPQSIYPESNKATLYKNLINFYQAVGTEDSFKMLFRLLYNDEIEIYYPQRDVLIASGGEYIKRARIRVNYVDNLNHIRNKKIVGANSGAYGTVESVEVLPKGSDTFTTGRIANTHVNHPSGILSYSNTIPISPSRKYDEISHPSKILEAGTETAFVYLTDYSGEFDIFEEVYYSDGPGANTSLVSNTITLPVMKRLLLFDSFTKPLSANAVVSINDGRREIYNKSTNPPWGSANVILGHANTLQAGHHLFFSNTGVWHTTGDGTGEIKLVSGSTVTGSFGNQVLEIGNNTIASGNGDYRQLVYTGGAGNKFAFGFGGQKHVYRMSVRARDVGGNSAFSTVAGNRFSAGIIPFNSELRVIPNEDGYVQNCKANNDTYSKAYWFVSDSQSIDDEFYVYTGYFKGKELTPSRSKTSYTTKNRGSGGRKNLPSGERYYNSLQRALDGGAKLPYSTLWFTPTIKVNESANGATFSQGITQIDFISLDEISAMQKQEGARTGTYRNDTGSLLSHSSRLFDGRYWQHYAYDIRSKQPIKNYRTVVTETTHPAGTRMFGTQILESHANGSYKSTENNLSDTFSPDQLNSLAGWWRADAIGPENVQWKKWSNDTVSNGIFGTNTNRMPAGSSDGPSLFESSSLDYFEDYKDLTSHCKFDVIPGESPLGGNQILRITDWHTSTAANFTLHGGPRPAGISGWTASGRKQDNTDYHYPLVLDSNKKWLVSAFSRTNNTVTDGTPFAWRAQFQGANTTGYTNLLSGTSEGLDAENTWQRVSALVDTASQRFITRAALRFVLADRTKWADLDLATGNTYTDFDGIMIEEYNSAIHGTSPGPYTPSPYVAPGMNGANVISWFDQSVNKHHVYANTYGGIFFTPQFIANAVNGMPAVRFSANTVKNNANVYPFSSIGGTVNSDAMFYGDVPTRLPTSGFQAKRTSNSLYKDMGGTLANPALTRPVSNTWTIMAVVKSHMAINASSYNTSIVPTIINSGYANNPSGSLDRVEGGTSFGTLNLGYNALGETGSLQTHVVNSLPGVASVNTSHITTFGSLASPATNNSFRIVGISVNASSHSASSLDDLLNFHIDGRRFANSEINNVNNVTPYTGMSSFSQNNYVTSIGKWRAANTTANQVNSVTSIYRHGIGDWDGDIAEILVFNEKLANVNIAKVEGYLAHKYGLQANLKHKDDDGNGGPEVEKYRWEFANTIGGWEFYDNSGTTSGSPTIAWVWEPGEANAAIRVTAPGSRYDMAMRINTAVQIDGSAYDKFAIRFNCGIPPTTTGYGRLIYTTLDGTTTSLSSKELGDSAVKTTGWHEHYIDLSGQSTWVGKKIVGLGYLFDRDNDGGQRYDIDWVYVSGNNHPHPYRYNTPPAIGANSWNLNY